MSFKNKKDPVLRDVPMPIRTPRLELRPVGTGDGAALNEAKLETWGALSQWMTWAKDKSAATVEADEITCRKQAAKFILRTDMMLVGRDRASDRPMVWTGLHQPDWETGKFVIGYWVRQSAQGQGYATESTNALVRYAFGALEAQRVEITHAAENAASRRVIEKLGFEKEAVFRNKERLPDGRMTDMWCYALLTHKNLPPLDVGWGVS